jgi:soluble P-type ATPase
MLTAAALGIAVLGPEGAAAATLAAAHVIAPDILAALDLLAHPQRLVATLRR